MHAFAHEEKFYIADNTADVIKKTTGRRKTGMYSLPTEPTWQFLSQMNRPVKPGGHYACFCPCPSHTLDILRMTAVGYNNKVRHSRQQNRAATRKETEVGSAHTGSLQPFVYVLS